MLLVLGAELCYHHWEAEQSNCVNLLATDFLFQILAHPVFKM